MSNSTVPTRLRLLATGGTIAGAETSGRGYRAAALSIEALVAAVPQIAALAALDVEQVARIGSQDMDEGVWRKLAARAQSALDDPAIAGVVITHGTDTMEETGYFLNLVLKTSKPVVLVPTQPWSSSTNPTPNSRTFASSTRGNSRQLAPPSVVLTTTRLLVPCS